MTANVGNYFFNAATVAPSTIDTQIHDTTTALIITGASSDPNFTRDKIVLSITKYKEKTGTFSIVQGQAGAYFLHGGVYNVAVGGLVAITKVTSNSLIGYFSFTTSTGLSVANGNFNVGKP